MPKSEVDKYLKTFPEKVRVLLQKTRLAISKAAPKAIETMSYGIPTFDLGGKHLVHFAAFKNHLGFFPTPSGIKAFKKELADYETSKGAVRFSLDRPIPFGLIRKITQFRVKEVTEEFKK